MPKPELSIPMYAPGKPLRLKVAARQSRQSESRIRAHIVHVALKPGKDKPDVYEFADVRLEMN